MDGSSAAFLFDPPLYSTRGHAPVGGILYVEDFDADPVIDTALAEEPAPVFSADDVAAAREAGRQEGVQAALADAQLVQAQLHSAAAQALADGLATARASLETVARAHAEDVALTVLAVLHAALPAAMRTHAAGELQAMMAALTPGLACEPELRVRTHPASADSVRESLIAVLPPGGTVLSVCAALTLADGEGRGVWNEGRARRDVAAIWAEITAALAPLGLPTLKEIRHDSGC